MTQSTPEKTTGQVGALCRLLNSNTTPEYLATGAGIEKSCNINCLKYVLDNPEVELVPGWIIWQGPGIVEAEHHCVIKEDGKLIDLTKQTDGEDEILFLPDPNHFTEFEDGKFIIYENYVYKKKQQFIRKKLESKVEIKFDLILKGKLSLTTEQNEYFKTLKNEDFFVALN